MHRGNPGDIDFYRAVCHGVDEVLELGAGAGRVARTLAEDGVRVHALEHDPEMAKLGRKRTKAASVIWHEGDMRDFDLGRRFPRILLPYNGLYALGSAESVSRCFEAVARHLEPSGYFVFDVWNATPFHAAASSGEELGEDESGSVASLTFRGARYEVFEATTLDLDAQRITARYRYVSSRDSHETEVESSYLLAPEIEALLAGAGLELFVRHGDFDQSAGDDDSDFLIATCRAKER